MAQHSLHGAEIERSLHGAGTNRNFHGVRSKRNQQLESALLTHTADQVSDSLRSVESFTSLPKKRLHIDLIPRMVDVKFTATRNLALEGMIKELIIYMPR